MSCKFSVFANSTPYKGEENVMAKRARRWLGLSDRCVLGGYRDDILLDIVGEDGKLEPIAPGAVLPLGITGLSWKGTNVSSGGPGPLKRSSFLNCAPRRSMSPDAAKTRGAGSRESSLAAIRKDWRCIFSWLAEGLPSSDIRRIAQDALERLPCFN
eukprot:CAMPEP_0197664820 /NCGR_PEP_ID=MMETSP1338-20131121/58874_1 /TAXON_ID=43686 ORGANISM="Pelagodinium beii, Strain RCC1491" /NCGR_SAMPLE_ID=MMETSP1338 /ASSEMBLY_ACC=CAM_ASM_000754 /LENGTH=155 /DNA_ID=CAMNT_0043243537 /DNA_START=268 /DNA_END=732 /DNA_ORIENTATION=-